ncbi:MAG: glycosyltransferase [Verrucomicrobia bacterium]|nr:glycosyltransferase [Verrucomicrobiota bacterium]
MKVSVIVPAFNEEKLLPATLAHLASASEAFMRIGWENEIVVCDNNSTDRTTELARTAGAKVVFEPVNQIARARNSGAAAASGDWLIFVDADSHPPRELFAAVAEAIQGGRVLGGGATVRMDEHSFVAKFGLGLWNSISRLNRWAAGSFVFCEAAAFRELGGFSQELFASEEIEFSQRLKKMARARGKRVVILHRHPILTSGRKLHLYSKREHLVFMLRTTLGLGRGLRQRETCPLWYDGRR